MGLHTQSGPISLDFGIAIDVQQLILNDISLEMQFR